MSSEKTITWRIDNPGMVNGVYGQKRGDVQTLPAGQAKAQVAQGHAEYGKVPLDKLGKAYEQDEDALKLHREVLQDYANQMPEEAKPFPRDHPNNVVIGRRYARKPEGWYV